jgi:hypothetical protein
MSIKRTFNPLKIVVGAVEPVPRPPKDSAMPGFESFSLFANRCRGLARIERLPEKFPHMIASKV